MDKELKFNYIFNKKKKNNLKNFINMTKENKIKELPSWFKGEVYTEGGEVTNPYSGCSCYLSATELSMYDLIKGSELLLEKNIRSENLLNYFYEGLWWFKDNSPQAYMILLD